MPVTSTSLVFFDLDDTLFAHRSAVSQGILTHRINSGGDLARADHRGEDARWNELEERHYHRYLAGELDFFGQRRARAREFVEPFGVDLSTDSLADVWFDSYFEEYIRAWRLHDDALGCLSDLEERGVRLGIITNGDPSFQANKLARLGIADRFEHVVASGSLGFTKPDARIFEHACELFSVATDRAIYVGDRLETDAMGAAGAGLTGLWLDRDGGASPEQTERAEAAGVAIIRGLAEVTAHLR